LGKYGEEGNQLIFKILKRGEHEKTGEADLALRYDLTVPLARVVAQYQNELPKFFKRYQIQPVWRADRPARGRFREFYQCDVDVLGSRSMVVEAELIAAASDALVALGFNDFVIRVNHRQVLIGLGDRAGIRHDHIEPALTTIDKLDKIGVEGVEKELSARIGPTSTTKFVDFFRELASLDKAADIASEEASAMKEKALNAAILGRLVEFVGDHEEGSRGVEDLRSIIELSEGTSAARRIRLDPSLARGLSYYTGAIIEINVSDLAGSLGGGGRYDNLVGMFLGKDVPACGFSLGLERIIVVMSEREMFPRHVEQTSADVMVACWNEDSIPEALRLANEIREEGVRVLFYPEVRKFPKQMFYADRQ